MSQMTMVNLQVPRRAQSLVIGKGRKIISDIMAETDTEIFIPPRDQQSSQITIKGAPESVKDAQEKIEHVLGYELDECELSIAFFGISKAEHSSLIGVNGALLKELRKKCGCHIHVPRLRDRERNVEVHGSAAAIELAQKEIEAIIGHPISVSMNGPVVENVNRRQPGESSERDTQHQQQVRSSKPRQSSQRSSPPAPLIDSSTGKRRLDKGRINDVFFLPPREDEDPITRVSEYIASASASVSIHVSTLDNQNLVVILQHLLSQSIPVRIIVKRNIPGSNLTEVRTLQSLGAQVKLDLEPAASYINYAVVDDALAINGSHTWSKAGSLQSSQCITVTNHRDFVRSFATEFNASFAIMAPL